MAENAETTEAPKKKLPIKTAIMIVAALVIEAVVLIGIFMMSSGPSPVQADPLADDEVVAGEQPKEVLVIDEKFQNTRTGRPFLYDIEVYIVIKSKYAEEVEAKQAAITAAIKTDLTTIFRRAEPAHLQEHELSTLTRQITETLKERFGYDPEGNAYVMECFLAEFKEYPAS